MNCLENIGFLGLGQMGGTMARRLLGQSFQLHVFDPSTVAMEQLVAGGAIGHNSARSVADSASIVLACLPSQEISMATAVGPDGVGQGKTIRIYAEMSTIGKETIEAITVALLDAGIVTVDAPITGGPPAARAGTLAMLVSGDPAAVKAVHPLLALIGREIYPMGERPGMAQTMKIVNNLVMAANMIVGAEGLSMGAKAGLDADMMMRVLQVGTGQSFITCEVLRRAIAGSFNFGAAISIIDKDVTLGLHEASLLGLDLPVIDRARQVWHSAYEAGRGNEDFSAILKVVEEKNGTLVRARAANDG
jgi:3-hydroxyisobutyrate dehydrogenase-like beta-hydroxyacid dehydrogenase